MSKRYVENDKLDICAAIDKDKKNPSETNDFRGLLVRVVRLERTVSWSQTRRDTNFAIPGYSLFCHDTTASGKNKDFSVCGHSCGQSRFCAVFCNRGKSSKRRHCKALRHFALPCPGYRHGTPKAGALPTALHPVIQFIYPAGRILPKQARYQLRYTRICTFRCGSMRLHTFCTHANLKEQRRFPPRPHSAIPLSGGARFLTAQAANLNILQFA